MSERAATKAQPSPAVMQTRAGGLLQRKCACGTHTIAGGECEGCDNERRQRRGAIQRERTQAPPIVHEVLRSPGQSLDSSTRQFMESRFQHDFSRVRVHADSRSAESAEAVNALAYTAGPDLLFGGAQYAPGTKEGMRLLAHELTHVVQQQRGAATSSHAAKTTILRDASHEREANVQGARVTADKPASMSFRSGEIMAAGTAPAAAIQLSEKSDAGASAKEVAVADAAQQGEGDSSTDEQGEICLRYYGIGASGGKVTWKGIDQATLDKNVRLKDEDSPRLNKATANDTNALDAIYFGPAQGRRVIKVPDHCTVTMSNFSNPLAQWCCNNFGSLLARLKGKDTRPRLGTAGEFGVPNDWGTEETIPQNPTQAAPTPLKGW